MLLLRVGLLAAGILIAGGADAGHEPTFYPSFYPQEITLRIVDPRAAATMLTKNALHAYVGADPFAASKAPAHITQAESLASLVVLRFHGSSAEAVTLPDGRCATGAAVAKALARVKSDLVGHPYPVTPFHADYLTHADLVEGALRTVEQGVNVVRLKVRATPRWVSALTRAGIKVGEAGADASLEEIEIASLLDGLANPAWSRTGWMQTYAVYAHGMTDEGARRAVDKQLEQRTTSPLSDVERARIERGLVLRMLRGCERVPIGYTLRHEPVNNEYSAGVENVAWDAQRGLNAPIFLRTVKLKDFPWNGWLALGVEAKPAAAWNPLAGFSDTTGRLVWAALADPAVLPEPRGEGSIGSRVRLVSHTSSSALDVPSDALVIDPGTGIMRPAGSGRTAGTRLVYRVLASKFHDETKMGAADVLHALGAAFRLAGKDPAIARNTALLRRELAAVRAVKMETDVEDLGELQVVREVPVLEVYLKHALDADSAVAVAPPWTATPWELTALIEAAVDRGYGALSEAEAKRRGVAWLDIVRDPRLHARLSTLAADLERQAFVPEALRGFVTVDQARQRWSALRRFARTKGHFLVTNGPYRLEKWSADTIVLSVFRDFSYPLGVGTFDRYALPLRAWPTRVERRGDRLEIEADVETITRAERTTALVREPFRPAPAGERMRQPTLGARYMVVRDSLLAPDVITAGTSQELDGGKLIVDLKGLERGTYRVVLALALDHNFVSPQVKVIPYRVPD